ncbi:MAG: hypothetical protein A2Z75_08365 [Chloroflexi bacterium RBG_13_50_10]|jgi:DNA-directed RNA polymerase subunit RPC12/RpoP|nr:MAG: hypothetical protein A2Z75_08365 [Chloroflexi bacterium RBG_13_50_10]
MKVKEGIEDKAIQCVDCGREFRFGVGEQKYFASKGLSTPKRCPSCRLKRRKTLVPDEGVQQ